MLFLDRKSLIKYSPSTNRMTKKYNKYFPIPVNIAKLQSI